MPIQTNGIEKFGLPDNLPYIYKVSLIKNQKIMSELQSVFNTINEKMANRTPLTLDEIKTVCPAVSTPAPNPELRQRLGITERYVHVPTTQVIEDIMQLGWEPIQAVQVNARKKKGFQRHMVKFINRDFIKEDTTEYPELLLSNSHDGTSSFTLDVGIFRLVCSNGMVVKSEDFGSMRVRHYGYDFDVIKAAVNEMMTKIPEYLRQVDGMKDQKLEREQQLEFARKAAMLRFSNTTEDTIEKIVDMEDVLSVERKEDDGDGLWEVFNRIQEKILNGKFQYSLGNKERKARPVKGFKQQVKLNQDLWELASQYLPETAAA